MSLIIGLTGQTGAGKTTACDVFSSHGCGIINCDKIAREVCVTGSDCLNELVSAFSSNILSADNSLNRATLGRLVFSDSIALATLNKITHPHILRHISDAIKLLSSTYQIIILDAPTLFESGANAMCDLIVCVIASETVTIPRIMQRDGVDEHHARNRLYSQHDTTFFTTNSNFVIKNNGDIQGFSEELQTLIIHIKELANDNSH